MKKPNTYKKFARRSVTFESAADHEIWLRGQFGQSNSEMRRLTNQSNGQINYRLRVLKQTLGLDSSLRSRWRNGNHPLLKQILRDYRAVLLADLMKNVVPVLVHPVAETVKIN